MATLTPPLPDQAAPFASPQEEALLNLVRTADSLERAFQLRLKPSGLTSPQYNVLRILRAAHPGGLTCSALGHGMIAAMPDTTRLLARLKTQKLLRQQRDAHDRRVLWNHITDDGLKVLANLDGLVQQAPRDFLARLTPAELGELTRLLRKARWPGTEEGGTQADAAEKASQASGKPSLPRVPLLRRPPE